MELNERRVNQQIRNFEKALSGYNYDEPLARYLTRFFKENKQMGSSDRRMTSRFCYNYFRLGNALKEYSITERLVFAEFLCEQDSALVSLEKPNLVSALGSSIAEKVTCLEQEYGFKLEDVFPFIEHISKEVSVQGFLESQFVQPDLFIRIKKGKEDFVKRIFEKNEISFKSISENTLALSNGTNLQKVSNLAGMYEVQDLSSQQTMNFVEAKAKQKWWDACAASGGKSLMFLDNYPDINLMVSDIRMSILRNLDERFDIAGIKQNYRKKVLDLSQPIDTILGDERFDGIILDAPCSGSGTWGRTPEMIQQFGADKLASFSQLQKRISSNVVPFLNKGASLVYITCSIYQDENEDVVNYLLANFNLRLKKMSIIAGYNHKADSMFAAHFIKE